MQKPLGLGALPAHKEGSEGLITLDGTLLLYINEDECDFHIDAKPGYRPQAMRWLLGAAKSELSP